MPARKTQKAVRYGSVPFQEQIEFFRQKIALPTRAYTDLVHEMHGRAFVVAGAMQDELVKDIFGAVQKAIEQGTTLATFRKEFDGHVDRYGWPNAGEAGTPKRAWRARVIYETNLRTSYQAGRYVQLKKVEKTLPYWEYVHSDAVRTPRKQHKDWNGLLLKSTDEFWQTHYPPNGWGCRCRVRPRSAAEVRARGLDPGDLTAPPSNPVPVMIGKNGPASRTVMVPEGVDPGWGYNPGEHAWGVEQARQLAAEADEGKWLDLPGLTPADYDLPAVLEAAPTTTQKARAATSVEDAYEVFREVYGAGTVLADPAGARVHVTRGVIDHFAEKPAYILVEHRETYLPFIKELVEKPAEVWVSFAKHEATGRVELRRRYLKVIELDKRTKVTLVCDFSRGEWVGLTLFGGKPTGLNKVRKGILLFAEGVAP